MKKVGHSEFMTGALSPVVRVSKILSFGLQDFLPVVLVGARADQLWKAAASGPFWTELCETELGQELGTSAQVAAPSCIMRIA